jgi:hypothetical protein
MRSGEPRYRADDVTNASQFTVAANSFPLDFKLEPEEYWPPSGEIRKITEHFRKLAQAVADSVEGEFQPVWVP